MARRRPLLLRILSGLLRAPKTPRRASSSSSKRRRGKPPAPRKTPSIRTGRGPYGAATSKMARGRPKPPKAPKPPTARELAAREQDAMMRKFERGELRGEQLRDFLRHARTAKNPTTLEAARRQARIFHGEGHGDIVELNRAEQRRYGLPRFVVKIGEKVATEYLPPPGSKRAGSIWRHSAGDRGRGKPRARSVGVLVADPRTGRTATVGGVEKFDPKQGLIG